LRQQTSVSSSVSSDLLFLPWNQFIVNNYNFSKLLIQYDYRELHVTIHFSRSFCLLSVFLVRCLIDRGFCWRRLTLSVLFRLTASSHSMPSHPGLLPSRLQRASWFRNLASSRPNFLHPERSARWRCKLFPLIDFCYRSKICPGDASGEQMASTEDPRKKKIILLLAGIKPGLPSCESEVLPLDHGLPLELPVVCPH
jgi:hypothetical protein